LDLAVVPAFRLEHMLTRRVLSAIPPEHVAYRPQADARTAWDLARHIVAAELRFLEGAAVGAFPDQLAAMAAVADLPMLMSVYEREFAVALDRLGATPDSRLSRVLDYRGVVSMPALAFVQLAMSHTIHHRGQLSVYLREVGVTVPPIYG
jgi:uncharacterized damage-inducible protein DinB